MIEISSIISIHNYFKFLAIYSRFSLIFKFFSNILQKHYNYGTQNFKFINTIN